MPPSFYRSPARGEPANSTCDKEEILDQEQIIVKVVGTHLEHFRNMKPPCRGMGLPDGVLLRHTLSPSLYFYLKTRVEDDKIKTQVYASDSPYDRQKAGIGSVITAMFEQPSDYAHLTKLERLIREWVEFVQVEPDSGRDFQTFKVDPLG
jgi:hypothetical protein